MRDLGKSVAVSKAGRVRGSCETVAGKSKEKLGGVCWKLMVVDKAMDFLSDTKGLSALILFLNFFIISIFRIVN